MSVTTQSLILLLSWWTLSALFSVWNKTLLRSYTDKFSPTNVVLFVTHVHLFFCGIIQSLATITFSNNNFHQRIHGGHLQAAVLTIIMTLLSNVITQQHSIAYNQIVKSTEPVFVLLFRWMFHKTSPTKPNLLGSLLIIVGMTIFVTGKTTSINIDAIAFGVVIVISSAYRSTVLKRLFESDDISSVTCLIHNVASIVTTVPTLLITDQSHFYKIEFGIICVGVSFWAYNTLSYNVLAYISVENHSVGKFGKNVFIFIVSVCLLGEARSINELIGIVVCCFGIFVFIIKKK